MAATLGLIVNPVAGLGGRVGLKGSDGLEIQRQARALGAVPVAQERASEAVRRLKPLQGQLTILTYPGEMGEDVARACGFEPVVLGSICPGETTAEDTRRAAAEMRQRNVNLILFAGGDGTARDVVDVIGDAFPALGIPAGVKIHSGAFAIMPRSAGELASSYLQGRFTGTHQAEVMDLDEAGYRAGHLSPKLYGYLRVPFDRRLIQGRKSPSTMSELAVLDAIALDVIDTLREDTLYVVGPGTTTRALFAHLGLEKTLLGVDVLRGRELIAADVSEAILLDRLRDHPAKIIVTPVGGQGYLLGRGNQPISPAVIRRLGRKAILVLSAPQKIYALQGRPLLIDTGDAEVDAMLCGYLQVITGYGERIVYRAAGG